VEFIERVIRFKQDFISHIQKSQTGKVSQDKLYLKKLGVELVSCILRCPAGEKSSTTLLAPVKLCTVTSCPFALKEKTRDKSKERMKQTNVCRGVNMTLQILR
jgi:hypothetical protein